MPKHTRSGRITLRVKKDLHRQLASLARELMLDTNALLTLMIHRSLPQVVIEAHVFRESLTSKQMIPLFEAWEQANPTRKRREFLGEWLKHVMGEPSSLDGLIDEKQPAKSRGDAF